MKKKIREKKEKRRRKNTTHFTHPAKLRAHLNLPLSPCQRVYRQPSGPLSFFSLLVFFSSFFSPFPLTLCASVLVGRTRDGQPLVAFSVQPRRGREGRRARTHAPAKQVWFVVYTCTHTHTRTHARASEASVVCCVHTHTHTLRASLSGTFLQTLPDLATPLKGYSLSPRSCPPTRSASAEKFGY